MSCGFSHDIGSEYIFALGDEEGFVTISDARNASNYDKFVQKSTSMSYKYFSIHRRLSFCILAFEVDNGVVLSLCFVPNAPERLITVSGSPKVGLWDLVKEMSVSFVGHTRSVRTVSIWPDNPRKQNIHGHVYIFKVMLYRLFYYWRKGWICDCLGYSSADGLSRP